MVHWVFNFDPRPNTFKNYVNSFPLFSPLSLAGFEKREGQCPIAIPADNDANRERSLGYYHPMLLRVGQVEGNREEPKLER